MRCRETLEGGQKRGKGGEKTYQRAMLMRESAEQMPDFTQTVEGRI